MAVAGRAARHPVIATSISVVILLIVIGVSGFVGVIDLSPGAVIADIFGGDGLSDRERAIFFDIRLPRIATGMVVGATLALSGAAYQAVFRNPLADPYLLGVSSGAGLGVTLVVVSGGVLGATPGGAGIIVAAFVGGVAAVAATVLVSRGVGQSSSATVVVLAGVAVAAFASAIQTYLQQRNIDTVARVYIWMLGNLNVTRWETVLTAAVPAALSAMVILSCARVLDVMAVGDVEARSLGIDPGLVRVGLVAVATLGTASAVAVSGLIGFVGIIVPHALRLIVGPGHRILLPMTLVWGAIFLVLADTLGRTLMAPQELPVGVVTAAVGAPFFLFILRRSTGTGSGGGSVA
ncbi:FecCD family ABC transporter permease [Corynebacterium pacaense]|uniref:FecCD family ABC transporter permease n=1 Tax=Corynebacterium pacaense TaxID=1816684 RepID=UPI0009BA0C61|nr:iron ABC transporter permease [Corynebacterium pacaense]